MRFILMHACCYLSRVHQILRRNKQMPTTTNEKLLSHDRRAKATLLTTKVDSGRLDASHTMRAELCVVIQLYRFSRF